MAELLGGDARLLVSGSRRGHPFSDAAHTGWVGVLCDVLPAGIGVSTIPQSAREHWCCPQLNPDTQNFMAKPKKDIRDHSVRIAFCISDDLLSRLDAYCRKKKFGRSGAIQQILGQTLLHIENCEFDHDAIGVTTISISLPPEQADTVNALGKNHPSRAFFIRNVLAYFFKTEHFMRKKSCNMAKKHVSNKHKYL